MIKNTFRFRDGKGAKKDMKEPVLVIMAAGMGSRFGGLKQIEPVDRAGHILIDFSIYDAILAGFRKIIFIIKRENEVEFRSVIGDRLAGRVDVEYVYQELRNLPEGFQIPAGREKPWGTGHAVLSCRGRIGGPFAVINADDYYGRHALKAIYDFLIHSREDAPWQYAMVGYVLGNTLTDNGFVARGVCQVAEDGALLGIKERTHIARREDGAAFTENEGKTWTRIAEDSIVSMNMWGFGRSFLEELEKRFPAFLEDALMNNPLKGEYFLPTVVGELLREKKASVKVLTSGDKWYGITYREDRAAVERAICEMKKKGVYPERLWA